MRATTKFPLHDVDFDKYTAKLFIGKPLSSGDLIIGKVISARLVACEVICEFEIEKEFTDQLLTVLL